jgi:rubrerythrin
MAYRHWTLDDIPWSDFDPSLVDPEIVPIVKAAALVEYNARDYSTYLCNVFYDDPDFQAAARDWAVEEVQHGAALGRWAEMVDPTFDLEAAFAEFLASFRIKLEATESVRGSRSGELVARCMVETGTSSYYTALRDVVREPVLQDVALRIAQDEIRHYKLFSRHLDRYLELERLSRFERLKVALARIVESEDEELAQAYRCANGLPPGDLQESNRQYMGRAYALYQRRHVENAIALVLKTCGFNPHGRMHAVASRVAWAIMSRRGGALRQQLQDRGQPRKAA